MKSTFVLSIFCLFLTSKALAFPELVTHGYPNCVACHVSPSGGGTMSEYGRSLSKELLSTWSYENEENFGEGLLPKTPEWLQMGGDLRFIQTYQNDSKQINTMNFWMQQDLEAAIKVGKFYADGAFGVQKGPSSVPYFNQPISRQHYLGYFFTDEFTVRVGKFLPTFGIQSPDHTIVTRDRLGFGQGLERLNLEASYLGEKYDVFLTLMMGQADLEGQQINGAGDPSFNEHGLVASGSLWLLERFKVGASYLEATADTYSRRLGGLYGILKLSSKMYLLSEWDYQWKQSTDPSAGLASGPAEYNKLGYELYKGLTAYLMQQESYLDLRAINTRDDSYGVGLQFYPRPHFEFQAQYLRERNMQLFTTYYDYGYLMGHYYF